MIPANALEAALRRYEGTVNSFVRGAGATMVHVEAQYRSAVRLGANDEAIGERTIRGVSSPPNADPQRVEEIKARFLK
jgi:tetrahydrodipicolinate N-succinyltransferase